jgi:hypothetical protein
MKTINFNNSELVELNLEETKNLNGGMSDWGAFCWIVGFELGQMYKALSSI